MEEGFVRHAARHIDHTIVRRHEIEREILGGPLGQDGVAAQCPECGSTMVYRGIGKLRRGSVVHHFECVHSHREVHSLSIIVTD